MDRIDIINSWEGCALQGRAAQACALQAGRIFAETQTKVFGDFLVMKMSCNGLILPSLKPTWSIDA